MNVKARVDALENRQGTNVDNNPPPLETKMDPDEYLNILNITIARLEGSNTPNRKRPGSDLTDGEFIAAANDHINRS